MPLFPSLYRAIVVACLLSASAVTALSQQSKSNAPSGQTPTINRHASLGSKAARQALSYRGVPYHFGGQSRSGIDCSGLIQSSFKQWGILLPRTSVEQYKRGITVPKAQIKPGDLVFFKNTYKRGVSHVGIYLGNYNFVHASSSKRQVTISSLTDPYYVNHWAGARRVALDKEPIYPDEDRGVVLPDPPVASGDKSAPEQRPLPTPGAPVAETETLSSRANRP